ncbi:MAG: aminotransferase class I/II-fold pyridoxal phosphate-dependent enzyme [Thermoanaerobaculia bacterium]
MDDRQLAEEFRRLGHRVIDELAEYFESVGERAVTPDVEPRTVEALFDEPVPSEGADGDAVLDELAAKLSPYVTHTGSGGYLGLITPSPLPIGVLGDLVASALNQNLGVWSIGPAAVAMERRVVRWLCDLAGYGPKAGGSLTSGGMMANLVGLKLARDHAGGDRAQHRGVDGSWAVYCSEERHVSVDKAADLVGLGRESVRAIPTGDDFRIDLGALEEAIERDRSAGVRPACLVAMAGSTNTGAVDDLAALRAIADREGMWLHADAAYGGGMLLSHRWPGLLAGLERADSITIDPHKWFYAPLDAGAILVRDAERLTRSFGMKPSYLSDDAPAEGEERYAYYVHSLEQSRRFRALKVWMSFRRYGTRRIGEWIDANVEQARLLHDLAEAHPRFVSAVAPPMSAACIRWVPETPLPPEALGRLHHDVQAAVERGGDFWIGTTRLKGHDWFRACPVNFRTTPDHMHRLLTLLEAECSRWGQVA